MPPCASIQRRQVASALPSAIALLGAAPPLCLVDTEVGEREQLAARVEHELVEVGRAAAAHGLERLEHLEAVADRCAERLVHVGEQAHDLAARLAAERDHRLGEHARASSIVRMKAPFPTFTSRTIACAPPASFFDMIDAAISES